MENNVKSVYVYIYTNIKEYVLIHVLKTITAVHLCLTQHGEPTTLQ